MRLGGHDRPTSGEAVRSRTGWRRDDNGISDIAHEGLAVDDHSDGSQPTARDSYQRNVVEGDADGVAHHGFDRHPRLHLKVVLSDGTQCLVKVRNLDLGEESELAQVDTQHRNPMVVRQPQRAEHGSVATEAD